MAQEKVLNDEILPWTDVAADGQEEETEQFEHSPSIIDPGRPR